MSTPSPNWQAHICFEALGRTWHLERAASMESLWETMTQFDDEDERLPYWAELWPSSLALAEWLSQHKEQLKDQHCLDIGCGIGYTALVGSMLGALVKAMDYELPALTYAQKNALHNALPQPEWLLMDWRKPALRRHSIAYAWAGDVMYEKRFAQPLAAFLDHVLAPQGIAWIAEPSRTVYDSFQEAALKQGLCIKKVASQAVTPLTPQSVPAHINIWHISRPSGPDARKG